MTVPYEIQFKGSHTVNDQTEILLREISERFGVDADHLWGVLVRQAFMNGVVDLLVCAAWAAMLVWSYRTLRLESEEWSDSALQGQAWVLWGVIAVTSAAIFCTSISDIIGYLVNPEYWALKQILL